MKSSRIQSTTRKRSKKTAKKAGLEPPGSAVSDSWPALVSIREIREKSLAYAASCSIGRSPRDPLSEIARLRWKVRRNPEDAHARWELGKKLDEAGWRGAVKQLRQACRLDGANPEYHQSLGEALNRSWRKGEDRLAKPAFRAALRLYRRKFRKRPEDADLFFKMARTLDFLDQKEKAVAAYRRGIKLHPDFAEAHWELSSLLRRMGPIGHQTSEEAFAELREAVRLKPESEEYHILLAMCLSERGDHAGAADEYRVAVRLNPANGETHWDLGIELEASGDSEGAEVHYREAERLDPQCAAYGRFDRGGGLIFHGDLNSAIEQLRKSVQIYPLVGAWNALGVAYHKKGNLTSAITAYRKALQLREGSDRWEHRHPLNNLGIALEEKGDFEGALREWRKILLIDKYFCGARNNIGRVFEKMGKLRRALKEYGKGHKTRPDCVNCQADYTRLRERVAAEGRSARRRSK